VVAPRTISPALTYWSWRRPVNAVNGTPATWASEISSPVSGSWKVLAYWIGVQACSPIEAMAAATVVVIRATTENRASPGVRRSLDVANVSVPATKSVSPIRSASMTTGANPARGAGLGSSSTAETRENS
jgi:hypothetical protein